MSTDKRILVRMNPIGYKIESSEIDDILDFTNQANRVARENIAGFFNISPDQLTKSLLARYAKACEAMTNISVGSYAQDIHTKLINTLSSAKRCFSHGEVVACIEVCALHGEMLANFLCIVHEEQLKTSSIIEKLTGKAKSSVQECLKEDNFYDALNQKHRIEWMTAGKIILEEDGKNLIEVHELRIKYFHHWDQSHDDIENDALVALNRISKVASKYLELLDKKENLAKIRAYLNLHFTG